MDQTQWNTLNQMLSLSKPTGKSGRPVGRPPGSVQTRVISASGSLGQHQQQRGGRGQLNGQQQEGMVSGGVVKSLLTGRQYAQSVLRPDVGRPAIQTAKSAMARNAAAQKQQQQQVSLLQPQWQQQQQHTVVSAVDPTVSSAGETQQIMLSGLPDNITPGEALYVVVDGVTYQIDSSNAEQLLAAAASGGLTTDTSASVSAAGEAGETRISLEDLANVSAEQQTLSLDYQQAAAAAGGDMVAVSAADVKLEMQQQAAVQDGGATSAAAAIVHSTEGQQLFETADGTTVTTSVAVSGATGTGNDQMQVGV